MKKILRRILILCILLVMTVTIGLIHAHRLKPPIQPLFSQNMPAGFSDGVVVFFSQKVVVIFDVPVGPDYQINAVNIVLTVNVGSGTVKADIHEDGGTVPGAVVVDLGSHLVLPPSLNDPFTPVGNNILQNGKRYWLVLTSPSNGAAWPGVDTLQPPTGVFTYVGEGAFTGIGNVTLTPTTYRYNLAIDADPIVAPPMSGNVVPACGNVDGRLNSVCEEPWQTAAVYCRGDGSIDVYGITDSEGWLAFRTTPDEIAAIGIPDENTMLDSSLDGRIRLYRLPSGEFQLNSPIMDQVRGYLPNGYVFRWDGGCP